MSYRFKKHLQDYRPRELFLTPAECQSLVNGCNPYLRRLVIVLLETGMRIHEALTLLFTDIATDAQTNIQYIHLRAENTKSNKDRYIPLTKLAMEQINQQKLEFPASLYVFTDSKGNYYRTTPKKALATAIQKAQLASVAFHTLRHTFASLKLQGLDVYGNHIKPLRIEVISELLGHADISITKKIYAKFDKQSIITAFLE